MTHFWILYLFSPSILLSSVFFLLHSFLHETIPDKEETLSFDSLLSLTLILLFFFNPSFHALLHFCNEMFKFLSNFLIFRMIFLVVAMGITFTILKLYALFWIYSNFTPIAQNSAPFHLSPACRVCWHHKSVAFSVWVWRHQQIMHRNGPFSKALWKPQLAVII